MEIGADYGALSMALASTKLNNEVGAKMLKNAMDTQEIAGNGILKMMDAAAMERSVNPAIGGNFDMSI